MLLTIFWDSEGVVHTEFLEQGNTVNSTKYVNTLEKLKARLRRVRSDGIIMTDYLEQGHTITGNYYSALLTKLRSTLAKKSRGKLQKGILLLHDNAQAHRSMMAVHTSMQCGFKILLHPPYSPDLAPSDFFLFPSLKKHLKGQRFHSNEDVISAGEEWFESHPKSYYSGKLLNR